MIAHAFSPLRAVVRAGHDTVPARHPPPLNPRLSPKYPGRVGINAGSGAASRLSRVGNPTTPRFGRLLLRDPGPGDAARRWWRLRMIRRAVFLPPITLLTTGDVATRWMPAFLAVGLGEMRQAWRPVSQHYGRAFWELVNVIQRPFDHDPAGHVPE